jgi:hypothetical protein
MRARAKYTSVQHENYKLTEMLRLLGYKVSKYWIFLL